MMGVHKFFTSRTKRSPASKEVIEMVLMEKFHWLPQEIRKIPYLYLEKLFLAQAARDDAESIKKVAEDSRKEAKVGAGSVNKRAKRKKTYREV